MILQALIIYNELLYVLTWQHQFSTTMATDHLQLHPGQAGCQVWVFLWLGPNCCCCCCCWWWWWWWLVGWLVVGCWLLGYLVGSFVCLFVCLFVCFFVLFLFLLLLLLLWLLLLLLLFSHENKLTDFMFFLKPLPVRLNVLRYQKSLAKRTRR